MKKLAKILLILLFGVLPLMMMHGSGGITGANAVFSSSWENSNGTNITDGGIWSSYSTGTVVTAPVYNGTYAAYFSATPSSIVGVCKTLNATYGNLYFRAYFYFPNSMSANTSVVLMTLCDSDWANSVQVVLQNTAGYSEWQLTTPSNTYSSNPAAVNPNTWYCIEVERQIVNGNGETALWVDGNMLCNSTSTTMIYGTQNVFLGVSDLGFSNFTAVADDVVASAVGPIGPELPVTSPTPTLTPSPLASAIVTSTPIVTPASTSKQTLSLAGMGEYLSVIAAVILLGALITGLFIQRKKN